MSYESLEEARKYHIQNQTHWIGESLGEYKHQIWDIVQRNNYKNIFYNKLTIDLFHEC